MPEGYQLLAPGAKVAVPSAWLAEILQSAKPRKKHGKPAQPTESSVVLKKLIDGFFDPWEIAELKGGTRLMEEDPTVGPIIKALRCKSHFVCLEWCLL